MVKKETISHNMLYCPLPDGSLQKAHSIFFFARPDMDKNHELKLSLFTKFSAFLPVAPFPDFTQINYKMLKNWTLLSFLLLLLSLPVTAQEVTDSVYEFRFVPQKDMFFVPYGKNRAELERLSQTISRYRREIADGSLPLRVDGYCHSLSGEAENMAVARLRSNRVKSELILHHGMTERCFVTRNHATTGDFVTVRLILPVKGREATPTKEKNTAKAPVTDKPEENADESASNEADTANEAGTADKDNLTEKVSIVQQPETAGCNHSQPAFFLRANLLRWATLTPDLGMEWRINHNWGVSVNGSWTSWSWDDKNRRYALWEVAPEVRYYIGMEKRGYIGAMYKVGQFNYKFSTTGRQGDIMGGGITGGYQLKLNRTLTLDFNLGIGCIHAGYDKYETIDGIRVKCGEGSSNWWGPVSAGVSLVWKLF